MLEDVDEIESVERVHIDVLVEVGWELEVDLLDRME